jgi:acyl-lipid omega-6 desaturase (Delta-12 desaturase)
MSASIAPAPAGRTALLAALAGHQEPQLRHSLGQIASTFLPLLGVIAAMYVLAGISPWLCLPLAVPAAALTVRVFIIQHDCGHGAFFRSRAANDWLGRVCSLVTLTPYANWRRQHANHHAVWNNLDKRQEGADIYSTCLTRSEYEALSPRQRFVYRLVRHPLIAQVLVPPLVFLLLYRVPFDTPRAWRRERSSVFATNAAIAALFAALVVLLGYGPVLLVHLPTMALAAIAGVWLFSVQHRFEHGVWLHQSEWNATDAALRGSSHLKLPRLLQWCTGSIGFHHLHHLAPRVPNYRLEECHRACADAMGATDNGLTFGEALRAPSYVLWDETRRRMLRFADLREPA